jgi:hypothetical protein
VRKKTLRSYWPNHNTTPNSESGGNSNSNSSPTGSLLSRRPLKMNNIHMNTGRTKKLTKPVKPSGMRREWFLKHESVLDEITYLMTVTPYNKALVVVN